MTYRICKTFRFEAAHQLEVAFSKACSDCIHGHSYRMEVRLVSDRLDHTGMVMDFGELKVFIRELVERWDHALLIPQSLAPSYIHLLTLKRDKVIVCHQNPTAEWMARFAYDWINDRLPKESGVRLEAVRIHETDTGWAEYEGGRDWGSGES